MKEIFLLALWITFLIVRPLSHLLHDKENYGTSRENSKTFTGYLRKKTKKDLHHIHLGILILIVSLLFFIFKENFLFSLLFGIGTSLVLDQILPLIGLENYFDKKMVLASFLLHMIESIIVLIP